MRAERVRNVGVRLTAAEYERVSRAARKSGATLSSHIRRRLLSGDAAPAVEVDAGELRELVRQVKAVGNNVNQISHRYNMGQGSGELEEDLAACLRKLSAVLDPAVNLLAQARGH